MTSLHLAILSYAGVPTFYGPAVVPSWGEYPQIDPNTLEAFYQATGMKPLQSELHPPAQWSNHFRDARTADWKEVPRKFEANSGWKVLSEGEVTAPIIVANLATLLTVAGADYFPQLKGKILLVEEMDAPLDKEERNFCQLERMGVFDEILGLIVGKPETLKTQNAPFTYDDLILENGGLRPYPIVSNFDCSHTHPMLTLAQMTPISLRAEFGKSPRIRVLERMVEDR